MNGSLSRQAGSKSRQLTSALQDAFELIISKADNHSAFYGVRLGTARRAKVGLSTLRDFEARRRKPIPNNLAAIRSALEAAGIEFTNGDVPGVRLRKKKR